MAAANSKTAKTKKTAAGTKKKTAAKTSSGKSTARKKTQTAKSSASAKKKTTIPVPQPKTPVYSFSLLKEVLVIAAFCFSIVLFVCCFQKQGDSLHWLKTGVFYLFGAASYLLPFFFFGAVCCLVFGRNRRLTGFRLASILLFVLASVVIASLAAFDGGIFGSAVARWLTPVFGTTGTYIVMFAVILIGVVMLTGHSLVSDMYDNSNRVRNSVKKHRLQMREQHELQVSERLLRKERETTLRAQERRRRIEELEAAREREIAVREEWQRTVVRGIGDTIVEPDEEPASAKGGRRRKRASSDGAILFDSGISRRAVVDAAAEPRTARELSALDRNASVDEYAYEEMEGYDDGWDDKDAFDVSEDDILRQAVHPSGQSDSSKQKAAPIPEPVITGLTQEEPGEEPDEREPVDFEEEMRPYRNASISDEWPKAPEDNCCEEEEAYFDEPDEDDGYRVDETSHPAYDGYEDAGYGGYPEDEMSAGSDREEDSAFDPSEAGISGSPYEQELPPDPVSDMGQPEPTVIEKNSYSNTAPRETVQENRTKTVRTATGKVINVELDGLPGEKKQPGEAKKRELAEKREGAIVPEEYIEPKEYEFPPISMLKKGSVSGTSREETSRRLKETAMKLQQTLQNFGVGVTVTNISCGPSVTRYELQPEQGVKVSKIVSLTDDIKLNLAAADIRMEAPIPGKAAIGIEVPNKEKQPVALRDLLDTDEFRKHPSKVVFAAGKDIAGSVILADIAKMPHLLIAGATGSGKSVCINTIIMSILYKAKPSEVKMIMIDPKVVELSAYNGIPHLLIPVVTDPKKAAGALNWAVTEMTDRYQKFAQYRVRDMKGYNEKVDAALRDGAEGPDVPKKMPQIVIIVDELADLMMVAPGDVEDAICRLAQMARAAGIHLVIATQRPSVNVITGLIKANVPSRIAFSVSSGTDSRTIIDMNGAEKLLGKGDMLFYPSGYPKPLRVQGCFVSDEEVQDVVKFLSEQKGVIGGGQDPNISLDASSAEGAGGAKAADRDEYFEQAGRFIIEKEKASIGMLQRMFKIGFNRAARIMDQLAEAGVVSEEEGTKPRRVLMTMEEFESTC